MLVLIIKIGPNTSPF